ncbi:o-succinylbenzoate--CoA ligase [Desmospora activa]|uniref:2-succinylbenzoate--CoA ligase n=1 Tax=Desmospora activa DSM 45169 TaxID=1121389 RepID=A0A2T4Z7H7_9BACL|nr:o-succinylbenzoate--CoA ligase [Desmospora activa]PTM57846.1 2-succinylbenzoyl-CoA synthetase [Desmospora activa DSM 45169]
MVPTVNEMPHWLTKRAFLTPEREAISDGYRMWTFQELHERAEALAQKLAGFGVKSGDRVALLLYNHMEYAAFIHGLSFLGAVAVPLNTRLAPVEWAWQVTDAEAKVWVFDESFAQTVQAITLETKTLCLSRAEVEAASASGGETSLLERIQMDDPATIMYTSGTTGRPKGVILTYGNHWWSAIGSVLNLGLQTDDKWLACVPLFHMSGLSILMRNVIYGIAVEVQAQFDPAEANRAICERHVTLISVVSNMATRMLDELGEHVYPDRFRCMLMGGGPAPRPLLERCKAKGVPVFQTYGMTETASQSVTLAPEDSLAKLGSAGKPLFPGELSIREGERELSPGEEGEIAVRGPHVTPGYWRRPEATQQAIQEGWLYTGDIGYVDQDGYLYVLDRRSDLILSGGENVYPAEVEAALLSHPAVAEAGVVGEPHDRWGEVPVAFVVLRAGEELVEEVLIQHCRERLARYKVPVRIIQTNHLPRNASNKLLRRKLKARLVQEEKRR